MTKVLSQKIYELAKGIDTYARDTMLKEDETALASNVISIGKNSISKRKGTSLLCTVSTAHPIDGLGVFASNSGTQLLAMCNGTLYQVQTGTAVAITGTPTSAAVFTPNLSTSFCQAGANLYIANGTDTLRYYDGTTIRERTNGIVAKYLIYYKSCLYGIGNTTYGSRLYRSGTDTYIGDFTYSTANILATSIYVSNNDGQNNTSFFKSQDYLYVTKNRSTYRVSVAADIPGTMSLALVDASRGSDSHNSTDAVENDTFIFNEYGVHSIGYEPNYLDQIRTKIISLRVDKDIQGIDKSSLDDTCAMFFDNVYHFAYRSLGSATNDKMMCYDRQRSGWWLFDLGASCFCEYKNNLGVSYLYYGSPTDGKVYYFDKNKKSDSGSIINTVWLSPKYTLKDYTQSKFFLETVLYMGNIQGSPTISVYVDGKIKNTKTVTIGATGFEGLGIDPIGMEMIGVGGGSANVDDVGGSVIIKLSVNKMGRSIQLKIAESSSDKSWELNGIDISFVKINKLYQPNSR